MLFFCPHSASKAEWRTSKSLEDIVFDSQRNEELQLAIQNLPIIQQRRLILHYEYGLTYEQIAEMDACTKVAVKYTIDKAKAAIIKKLK